MNNGHRLRAKQGTRDEIYTRYFRAVNIAPRAGCVFLLHSVCVCVSCLVTSGPQRRVYANASSRLWRRVLCAHTPGLSAKIYVASGRPRNITRLFGIYFLYENDAKDDAHTIVVQRLLHGARAHPHARTPLSSHERRRDIYLPSRSRREDAASIRTAAEKIHPRCSAAPPARTNVSLPERETLRPLLYSADLLPMIERKQL